MIRLNLPNYVFKYKKENSKTYIFDNIRKKYIVLTPEEWVRQNIVAFLIKDRNYPASLFAIEMGIDVLNTKKRCDVVVYDNKGIPSLIVECKAPKVKINQNTFDQIARYNMTLKTKLLIVTNGFEHYTCTIDHNNMCYNFLKDIPFYSQ